MCFFPLHAHNRIAIQSEAGGIQHETDARYSCARRAHGGVYRLLERSPRTHTHTDDRAHRDAHAHTGPHIRADACRYGRPVASHRSAYGGIYRSGRKRGANLQNLQKLNKEV